MAFKIRREEIVERFIKALKSGTAPWQRPWTSAAPYNAGSKRRYTGVNALLLNFDPDGPAFLTWHQMKQNGGTLEKGTHGRVVVFVKPGVEIKEKDADGNETGNSFHITLLRGYKVFPTSKMKGLPERFYYQSKQIDFEPVEKAEEVVKATGARINYGGDMACYTPNTDEINMPVPDSFVSSVAFYNTEFHELGHWTGHKSRLDRLSNKQENPYAFEELIAEITAAMVSSECGLDIETMRGPDGKVFDNSTAYCAHWAQKLQELPAKLVISAASKANAAADFIVSNTNKENETCEE